jgi:hypothetical protein
MVKAALCFAYHATPSHWSSQRCILATGTAPTIRLRRIHETPPFRNY